MAFKTNCGPPSEDQQEFQCQAKSQRTGNRCRAWALRTRKYCACHGGKSGRIVQKKMSCQYTQYLGPTFKAKLEEYISQPHHKQVSLHNELGIVRIAAEEAVKLGAMALEGGDPKTKDLALQCMMQAMSEVKDMAIAVSKIEKDLSDKVSLQVLDMFILQIMKCIEKEVPLEVVGAIQHRIDTEVRLPKPGQTVNVKDIESSASGVLTPAEYAKQMDNTILEEDPDANESLD